MEPWPFDTITPAHYDELTEADPQLLEALVQAYVAEIMRQRDCGIRPAPG